MLDLISDEPHELVGKKRLAEQIPSVLQGKRARIVFRDSSGDEQDWNRGIDPPDSFGEFQTVDRVGHHDVGQN